MVILEAEGTTVEGDASTGRDGARSGVGHVGKTPVGGADRLGSTERRAGRNIEEVEKLLVVDLDVADKDAVSKVAVNSDFGGIMLDELGRLACASRCLGKQPTRDTWDREGVDAEIAIGFGLSGLFVNTLHARQTKRLDVGSTFDTVDAVEDDIECAREDAGPSRRVVAHHSVTLARVCNAIGEHQTALALKERLDERQGGLLEECRLRHVLLGTRGGSGLTAEDL